MPNAAIIVAAGTSRRMGFDKLAAELCGKAVLSHTIEAFCRASSIDEIYVVCTAERFATLDVSSCRKPIIQIDGGDQRQDSVHQGLLALPAEIAQVAVHDGARALISAEMIDVCMKSASECGAAALGKQVTETLKRTDPQGYAHSSVDRADLWFMETPQCFHRHLLVRAYEHVFEDGLCVTDEVSAMESIGVSTKIIENRGANLKITLPADLIYAEFLMEQNREMTDPS